MENLTQQQAAIELRDLINELGQCVPCFIDTLADGTKPDYSNDSVYILLEMARKDKAQQETGESLVEVCGCCGAWHRKNYHGDCRNDDERFFDLEDAEKRLGFTVSEWYTDPQTGEGYICAK